MLHTTMIDNSLECIELVISSLVNQIRVARLRLGLSNRIINEEQVFCIHF